MVSEGHFLFKVNMKKKKAPPFVMLRRDLLRDKTWRELSSSAKVVYIYLRSKYNHVTKDNVTLSYTEMKDVIGTQAMSQALKELQEQGFIEKIKKGGLYGGLCVYNFKGLYKEFF